MINDNPIERLRTREQSNYDVRAFASMQDDDSVLSVAAPERTPTECERYSLEELRPGHISDLKGHQLIRDEVAHLADLRLQLRSNRLRRDTLYQEYRASLRSEWRRLLSQYPRVVVFYKKTFTTAWRKAKWKKIPNGFRTVRIRVHLKARPVWRYRYEVQSDLTRKRVKYLDPAFRPYVFRELKVPNFVKVLVRPAGFRRVVVRTKTTRKSYDWTRIRPAYAAFKVNAESRFYSELAVLDTERRDIIRRIADRVQQPHRLVACTDTGYIPPSWEEYYYLYHAHAGDYEKVYQRLFIPPCCRVWCHNGPLLHEERATAVLIPRIVSGDLRVWKQDQDAALEAMRAAEIGHDPNPDFVHDFEAPRMLHPRTVVDRLVLLDKSSDPTDESLEQLAASTVGSLRKGSDYVFNLPRSIGELKDLPGTYDQARDFMRWFAGGTRSKRALGSAGQRAFDTIVRRTHSASLALVGGFLAWKFAIQPTIQDCLTLRTHSKEWILSTHRALRQTISNLRATSTNVLHVRSSFRGDDYLRDLTVQTVDSGMVTVEATVPLRINTPAPYVHHPGSSSSLYDFYVEIDKWRPHGHSFVEQPSMLDCHAGPSAREFSGRLAAAIIVGGDATPREFAVVDGAYHLTPGTTYADCDFPLDEVKAHIRDTLEYPAVGVPGYLHNQVSGVLFARYQIGDILTFLQNDGLIPDLERLEDLWEKMKDWDTAFDVAYNATFDYGTPSSPLPERLEALLASVDAVYVAWQLTPLSFIYDWFTNSESVATRLNNFETEYYRPPPPSLDGVWVTKRCELMAGRPGLSIYQSKLTTYVSDWYAWRYRQGYRHRYSSDPQIKWSEWNYSAEPARISNTLRFDYLVADKVQLSRSGLYAAKRGEHIAGGWETFLPQVRVKLNLSKVGTLLGMLGSRIRPRAQA